MSADTYQLCPGGTGKKLKFCCADLANEIPKLEKMIEAEQRLACLDQIQRLEEKHPDRACLLTLKTMVQGMLGRSDEAEATIRKFSKAHPQNAIALSQSALLAGQAGRMADAVAIFGRAMEHCPQEMPQIVYQSLTALADALLMTHQSLAALAILRAQVAFAQQDSRVRQSLSSLERAAGLPLLIRDDTYPELDPRRAGLTEPSQQEAYIDALRHMFHVRYAQTIAKLEAIAGLNRQAAEVWRTLGYVRAYALDSVGAVQALRKFTELSPPADDAVEAEALAQLLADEDLIDHLYVEYPVSDADQVAAALVASNHTIEMPVDPRMAEAGEPPPRAAYAITDRPLTEDTGAAADAIPVVIARIALFGKQTDREARLEVSVTRPNLDTARNLLATWLPNSLGAASEPEVVERRRLTAELTRAELQLPRGLTPERSRALQADVLRHRVLEVWPNTPLNSLAGKTPLEAAQQADARVRLGAALLNLELEVETTGGRIDFAPLRQKLNLPPADRLDPTGIDLERLPLARLRRLDFVRLSDEQLQIALERAAAFDLRIATKQAAEQIATRPALMNKLGPQRVYYVLASACEDPAEALQHLAAGRAAAAGDKESTIVFDLQELEIQVAQRNMPEVERLLNHVLKNHGSQPGVREAVGSMLMSAGIMVVPPEQAGRGGPLPPPGGPAESPAESGGIWTPDSARGGSQKSALWTPGMD